ncbi:MAG TPA: protein-L-isoaspartate(D-aspartate) O-methyltransferase, partial [Blastocatellia bacterium]|nr:protein-L-isoaspartate(D-aspartate) O-methyltransferase [Blastocatellia bacterium]
AVIAQRLAKRICVSCRKVAQPDSDVVDEIFPDGVPDGMTFYRGTGCNHCNGFGTHGRIAVVEYLPAEIELRRAISRHLPVDELRALAVRLGLIPLRDHALELARSGIIALEELPMILSPEQLAPPKRLHA